MKRHFVLSTVITDNMNKVNPMKVDMILGHLSNRLRRLSLDYVKACAQAAEDA